MAGFPFVNSLYPPSQPLAPPPGVPSVARAVQKREPVWRPIIQRILAADPYANFDKISSTIQPLIPKMPVEDRVSWQEFLDKQGKNINQSTEAVAKSTPKFKAETERQLTKLPGDYVKPGGIDATARVALPNPPATPQTVGDLQKGLAQGITPPQPAPQEVGPGPSKLDEILDSMGWLGAALKGTAETAGAIVKGTADLPGRAIEGAQKYTETGDIAAAADPAADVAMAVTGGAAFAAPEAGLTAGLRRPKPTPIAPTDPEAAVLSRVAPAAPQGKTPIDPVKDFVDDLVPLKRFEIAATGGKVDTPNSPYDLARLSRGVGGKIKHFFNHGPIDFNTMETTGRGLKQILSPVKHDIERFKAYALSRRAEELQTRGIQTDIPPAAARATIDAHPEFKEIFDEVVKFQDESLRYLKDAGIISDDAYKAMKEANADYIPFNRLVEDVPGKTAGRGLKTHQPVRQIVGSARQIVDPLESIVKNTQLYVTLAERNNVLRKLVDTPGASNFIEKVKPPVHAIEVTDQEIGKFLREHDLPEELAEPMEIFRRGAHRLGPDEIAVWRDGKKEVYRVDKDIADVAQGMDATSMNIWNKLMKGPASMLRAGVVLSPDYMGRNLIRDQLNAAIQSKHGYRPVYDFMKGLWQKASGGEDYQKWLKSGGSQAALVAMDRDYAGHDLLDIAQIHQSLGRRVKNVASSPVHLLQALSESIDDATRIGEFMRATKGSKDPAVLKRGGLASRDVTQDFQRKGAKVQQINSIVPFLNAQIQGMSREFATVRDKPLATLAKVAGMVTLPSVLTWYANHGDPRYDQAPNWEKDIYWLVLPSDPNAEPIRIPKPFTYGMIFGSLPERMLSDYFQNKPEAYHEFGKDLLGTLIPPITPTIALPFIENWANRSMFTGSPLVSERLERKAAPEQFNDRTSEIAKLIGKGVAKIPGMDDSGAASPIMIDNLIRQYTGTIGQSVTGAMNPLLRPSDAPPRAAMNWSDVPFIRAFISRYPTANSQPMEDVFRYADRASKGLEEDPNKMLDKARRSLWAGYKSIRGIQDDPQMDPETKRVKMREIYMQMRADADFAMRAWRNELRPEVTTKNKDDVGTTQRETEIEAFKAKNKNYKAYDEKAELWMELEKLGIKVDHRWSVTTLNSKLAAARAAKNGPKYGGTE